VAFLLAHAGHYALYVLYAVPVIVVLTSIVVTTVRERRLRDGMISHPPEP
jgi:heme exporter protein D